MQLATPGNTMQHNAALTWLFERDIALVGLLCTMFLVMGEMLFDVCVYN